VQGQSSEDSDSTSAELTYLIAGTKASLKTAIAQPTPPKKKPPAAPSQHTPKKKAACGAK
jgi:hypothetical protein